MRLILVTMLCLFAVSCSHGGYKSHKDMWKMMDADSDGEVTRAEFDKAHGKKFEEMDANGDGKVTKDEMKAHKKSKCKKCKKECKDGCKMKGHKHMGKEKGKKMMSKPEKTKE